ncbi:MAG: 16S rRNA (guanine(527)-N(7))-methyltransferase RsmG [Clostridia bacterium]|nr:16S rRNA (guanine(527)-N(7))-methyltransferase RsmG [Clostridia bacterium]
MEKEKFFELFRKNLRLNGLETYDDPRIIDQFHELTVLMLAKNEVMNITAIKDVKKIIPLHYMDCIKISKYIQQNAKVLDVGCGGGFPTLPLAIVRPDLTITALDSTEKKVKYVQETSDRLDLKVKTIAERAEILAQNENYREKFDVVTSRAVARLNILNELCLPFVKTDGKAVIMKGAAGQEELNEAKSGIEKLGGINTKLINDEIWLDCENHEKRTIIVIEKKQHTPIQYPRQFGQIKKKPL